MTNVTETFNNLLNSISLEIDFDSGWNNGTGYFDGLVSHETDEPFRFKDEHGRMGAVLPIGSTGRNVVIFQRYAGRDDVYVINVPKELGYLEGIQSSKSLHRLMEVAEKANSMEEVEARCKAYQLLDITPDGRTYPPYWYSESTLEELSPYIQDMGTVKTNIESAIKAIEARRAARLASA